VRGSKQVSWLDPVVAALAAIAGFALLSPEAFASRAEFLEGFIGQHNRYTAEGVWGYLLDPTWPAPPGWRFHFFSNLPTAFGVVGYVLALAGLGFVAFEASWAALPLLGYALAAGVMVAPLAALFVRYADPLVPSLAVGLGLTLARLWTKLRVRHSLPVARAGQAALLALALGPPAMRLWQFDRLMARPDTRELAQQWLVKHGGTGATLNNYTRVHLVEPSWEVACRGKLPDALLAGSWPETPDRDAQAWDKWVADDPNSLWLVATDVDYKGTDVYKADYLLFGTPVLMCGKLGRVAEQVPSNGCFERVDVISPGKPACSSEYDMFDNFFVPYAGFEGQHSPGPQVEIFRNHCKH
jgi:hypothetical protein